jgi:serine/threonine protein kinase
VILKQPIRSSSPSHPLTTPEEPSSSNYKYEDLQMLCTIGTGTFGRVKLVQHRVTQEVYALKCMKKEDIVQYHQQKNILNEKNILFLCSDSPFISQLYATYNRPNAIYMLMEYIQGGELLTHLYDRDDTIPHGDHGGFTLPCIQFYAANLVEIFLFFERKNILYRDLKPENILLDRHGWLKIVDFGFAKQLQHRGPAAESDGSMENGETTGQNGTGSGGGKTYTLCGTQNYLSPEMILSIGYDRAVDYWALGCLLYELLLAIPPFEAEFIVETYQKITAYKPGTLPFPDGVDPTFMSLINSLLIPDPSCRLGNLSNGVKDIRDHLFFQGIDWNAIAVRSCVPPYVPQIESAVDTSNFFDFDQQEDGGGGPTEVDDALPYEGRQDYFDGFS